MYKAYLRLKACPKCRGDLLFDRFFEGDEAVCIQCGFRRFKKAANNRRPLNELEKTVISVNRQANSKARIKV